METPIYKRALLPDAVKWSSYLHGMVSQVTESSGNSEEVSVPHSTKETIDLICEFLEHWKDETEKGNDLTITDENGKVSTPLTDWDVKRFGSLESIELINFMQSVEFLGIQILLDKAIKLLTSHIKDFDIPALKTYLRTDRDFTKEEEEIVRARVNIPYY